MPHDTLHFRICGCTTHTAQCPHYSLVELVRSQRWMDDEDVFTIARLFRYPFRSGCQTPLANGVIVETVVIAE